MVAYAIRGGILVSGLRWIGNLNVAIACLVLLCLRLDDCVGGCALWSYFVC